VPRPWLAVVDRTAGFTDAVPSALAFSPAACTFSSVSRYR
jgi:hypothetical protein